MGKTKLECDRGYSLVEVIVAAALVIIAIVGTITVLTQGTGVSRDNLLRLRAYEQLERVFESQEFSWASYDSLHNKFAVSNPATIPLSNVVLDQRSGGGITATRWVKIYDADYSASGPGGTSVINTVPAIKLKAYIAWSLEAGKRDTVMLETLVTQP